MPTPNPRTNMPPRIAAVKALKLKGEEREEEGLGGADFGEVGEEYLDLRCLIAT